jgi:hypothetical protein
MQSNPYPNDPNYRPPIEGAPPATPYQPGPSFYQSQPEGPYAVPPNQYESPPAQTTPSATQRKKQARKYGVAKVMDYLQWVLFALEALFLLRFCLKLLGADPTNPFAVSLYNLTGFFLYPFEGIVPITPLGTQGVAIIEWSTLVGMAVYALLFYLVRLLLYITISRPEAPIA